MRNSKEYYKGFKACVNQEIKGQFDFYEQLYNFNDIYELKKYANMKQSLLNKIELLNQIIDELTTEKGE